MSSRLFIKLEAARESVPHMTFGAFLESVEDVAWDLIPQRYCSARLVNMSDELFEQGLDKWMSERGVKSTEWKS